MDASVIEELVGNAHGNHARVRELLDAHPEALNERAAWNETAIEAATQMGNRAIIEDLVGRGAPVDFFTALVLGQVDRIRGDLARDPGLATARGVHDLAPMYFAAIGCSIPAAEVLLEAGADVNAACEAAAPIHGAVMGGSAGMVRWLLDHGADPALPDYKGRGAAALARDMGRADLEALFA